MALWLLLQQPLMALLLMVMPLAVLTAVLGGLPVAVALASFVPLLAMAVMLSFELVILRDFGRDMRLPSVPDYLMCLVSAPAYRMLLAVLRPVGSRGSSATSFAWEKTPRRGSTSRSPHCAHRHRHRHRRRREQGMTMGEHVGTAERAAQACASAGGPGHSGAGVASIRRWSVDRLVYVVLAAVAALVAGFNLRLAGLLRRRGHLHRAGLGRLPR